jgi:hypothetical protein
MTMSSITLRFLSEPSTANDGGKVHGVTVDVDGIRLHRQILIGAQLEAPRAHRH